LLTQVSEMKAKTFRGFLVEAGQVFLSLDDSAVPVIRLNTKRGEICIFALGQAPMIIDHFCQLLRDDLDRFKRLSRAFALAQPRLEEQGVGWVVTRFAGAAHLSLRVSGDILIIRIPKPLASEACCLAAAQGRFLDCAIKASHDGEGDGMPVDLALELADLRRAG